MRVITGIARGRRLETLPGDATRPTGEKVKEGIFSSIQFFIEGADVLDLFAGSGQLGIEALSRGAKSCVFVDSAKVAQKCIAENIKNCGFEDVSKLKTGDALMYLSSAFERFDIAFLDPPYAAGLYDEVFSVIKERSLLKEDGLIVAECDTSHSLNFAGFSVIKDKTYGKVRLYVLEDAQHEKNSSVSR
jgi:16S rRNA (guanine(966)-N(2))-methyltransferase RsmD